MLVKCVDKLIVTESHEYTVLAICGYVSLDCDLFYCRSMYVSVYGKVTGMDLFYINADSLKLCILRYCVVYEDVWLINVLLKLTHFSLVWYFQYF